MKFVDEYRDPAAARSILEHITKLSAGGHYKFMEVCARSRRRTAAMASDPEAGKAPA